MYNDVIERNKFINDFNIPVFFLPVEYDKIENVTVLNDQDWDLINYQYEQEKLVIVDNFIKPPFVQMLRDYTLITNLRHDLYPDYAALNFHRKNGCLWFKLLSNIVEECKNNFKFLKKIKFERAWSLIFNNFSGGVRTHADPASITFNMWVTPNENMYLKPEYNGLKIWKIRRPDDWGGDYYNGNEDASQNYINDNNVAPVLVPYSNNRVVIFDSCFFHKSMPVRSKPGYHSRRINYTFLFSEAGGNHE